jgi:hypothetical protein
MAFAMCGHEPSCPTSHAPSVTEITPLWSRQAAFGTVLSTKCTHLKLYDLRSCISHALTHMHKRSYTNTQQSPEENKWTDKKSMDGEFNISHTTVQLRQVSFYCIVMELNKEVKLWITVSVTVIINEFSLFEVLFTCTYGRLKANSRVMPFPCRAALIHTFHAMPLPFSDSAVSFVKVRVVAGNIRTASPTV